MHEALQTELCPKGPHENSLRGEALRVCPMHEALRTELHSEDPHEDSLRGEALRVCSATPASATLAICVCTCSGTQAKGGLDTGQRDTLIDSSMFYSLK